MLNENLRVPCNIKSVIARGWRLPLFDMLSYLPIDTYDDWSGQLGMQPSELRLQLTAQIYICRVAARARCLLS